jgi:uncharacterized CHY-type Zn-finger protein
MSGDDIAMQTRCVHCGREQYILAVIGVSTGEHPCVWCGVHSEEMTRDEYVQRLMLRRQERELAAEAEAGYDPDKLQPRRTE